MLPNPPTPPSDYSSETAPHLEGHNGLTTSTSISPHPQEQFATPISNASMGLDDMDEGSDREERSDISNEDQDMNEQEGPLYTMTPQQALAMNAEMDALDAELMGPENMAQLWTDAYHYQGDDHQEFYLPYHQYPTDELFPHPPQPQEEAEGSGTFSNLVVEDVPMHGTNSSSDLPTTMSEVSLQLQQIHDGQEHAETADAADDLHAGFQDNNSITSTFFAVYSPMLPATATATVSSYPPVDYVSVPQSLAIATSPTQYPSTAPPLWLSGGFTPSDVVVGNPVQGGAAFWNVVVDDDMSNADLSEVEDQYNLSVRNFLHRWGEISAHSQKQQDHVPRLASLERQRHAKLRVMKPEDLRGDECDIQRMNWQDLGVKRVEVQQMRRKTYKNYTNLRYHERRWHPSLNGTRLPNDQNFFRFRRMDFSHNVHLSHFQLRNLIACPTPDHLFYAGKSKVLHWNPALRESWNLETPTRARQARPTVAMNLTDPSVQPFNGFQGSGIQISTLTVAHDILVAGGFCGEYGLLNLRGRKGEKHTEGLIIDHTNSITNHVQVFLSRQSALPQAVFASNDMGVRTLDLTTNKFVAEHMYEYAMNCSAISPDHRLRVLVGDTRQVMICNADSGEILQSLDGHHDFGFACDWADDGWTVATGNQDMQIKIWDARKWTKSDGRSNPLATIAAEMAGVRKLKFSPVGSGKRVLLAAEPADYISVIDAGTFCSKQTLSFFGEIGGVDFTNDGQDIWVANCDDMRGGLIQFERCGLAGYGLYELEEDQIRNKKSNKRFVPSARAYDWISNDEELDNHYKARSTREVRGRRGASLGVNMGIF